MHMRVLIITAVEAEKAAVLRGLGDASWAEVHAAGVGMASAAAGTATALAAKKYDLVISAGIAGGFSGQAAIGSLVVSSEIVAADLGAETPGGFCSLDELGFGSSRAEVDGELSIRVTEALLTAGLKARRGSILTVSTVTGTAATAAELVARVPGASAEAMEGYGIAVAANQAGVPVLELRAISNPVGPRDKALWQIGKALDALAEASAVLKEVL